MFVDRQSELAVLERESRRDSSFVVIYGRRRTGKTSLIQNFIEDKPAIYFLATEEPEIVQRSRFQRLLFENSHDKILQDYERPLKWESLFVSLSRMSGKIILVIDEFQYLAGVYEAFPSVLQHGWDEILRESGSMVILCGSLVSMMESMVLHYNSPLYGRRTAQLLLNPLDFEHYGSFFPFRNRETLLSFYSVTGGIPKYIEEANCFADPMEFIEESVLDKDSYLFREPYFLLEKEVGTAGTYLAIISQIAAGKTRLGEIASVFNENPSYFTRYLKVLRDLGFIERLVPVTEDKPEKSKKGIYMVKDRFLSFWFRYVMPYISYLELRRKQPALEKIKKSFYSMTVPSVYEDLCREALYKMAVKGELPFVPERIGKWWDKECDIDVVGLLQEKLVAGECKYSSSPMSGRDLFVLEQRAKKLSGHRSIYFVLFSRSGFTKELEQLEVKRADLKLVSGIP